MTIIEQFQNSKTGDLSICEDSIFVSENFVAVIDGATSKSAKLWGGKTSGKVAAELLAKEMEKLAANISAQAAMVQLNDAIARWYTDEGVFDLMRENPVERATASIVIFSKATREIWLLSDCQARVDDEWITNGKAIDTLMENLRAFFLEIELRKGKTIQELLEHDTGRDVVVPLIAEQTLLQNIADGEHSGAEFAYDVLDGFFTNTKSVKVVKVARAAREIVLASDGYPFLEGTLAQSETALEKLLKEDPLCFRKFRSTKGLKKGNISFDDRSCVRIDVSK
jgi:glycerophosphoryl diester phosphodiesterase